VVDDGSTDETSSILKETIPTEGRVSLLQPGHSGTSGAKNNGYAHSAGDVVFFAEADAVYNPDYLEKAVDCLLNDDQLGGVCMLGGIWEARRTFVTRSIETENAIKHKLMREGRMKPYFAWVFSRKALQSVGLYDTTLKQAEDRDLFRRVTKAGFKIGLVEGVNWRHRRYETVWQFTKKSYTKGKARIVYLAKGRRTREFLRGVSVLWTFFLLLAVGVLLPELFLLIVAVAGVGLGALVVRSFYLGSGTGARKSGLLLLPVYQLVRYLSNALGYTVGIFSYAMHWRKGRADPTGLQSVKPSEVS